MPQGRYAPPFGWLETFFISDHNTQARVPINLRNFAPRNDLLEPLWYLESLSIHLDGGMQGGRFPDPHGFENDDNCTCCANDCPEGRPNERFCTEARMSRPITGNIPQTMTM